MDHFVPTQLIDKRIGEFSQEAITAEEVNDFYSLERVADADDGIPYGWSSSINSLDGVTSIGDMDAATSVKTIGLKLHPKAQSRPDFRLLSGGWMYADAVIFSGASLRDESNQKLLITIPNFVKYRREVLQKPTDQPDLVIVTASGNIPQQHPIWDTDRRKMIATSAKGAKCISQEWAKEKQIHVETFEGNEDPNSVDLESMLRFLKREWSVKFFDLCSGPRLISSMINKCVYSQILGIRAALHSSVS